LLFLLTEVALGQLPVLTSVTPLGHYFRETVGTLLADDGSMYFVGRDGSRLSFGKLAPGGSTLTCTYTIYSRSMPTSIALTPDHQIWVAGLTDSSIFPAMPGPHTDPFVPSRGFLIRVNPCQGTTSRAVFWPQRNRANALAVGRDSSVYVAVVDHQNPKAGFLYHVGAVGTVVDATKEIPAVPSHLAVTANGDVYTVGLTAAQKTYLASYTAKLEQLRFELRVGGTGAASPSAVLS